jgi:deoxyadenosine/deoxycytidine kinase
MKNSFVSGENYIVERSSIESKNVFAQVLYDSGDLTKIEHQLYEEIYESLGWEPDMIIYIKTDPEICFERIQQRSRECETEISIDYIKKLHTFYEIFFEKYKYSKNIFVVDGNQSPLEVYESCARLLNIKM